MKIASNYKVRGVFLAITLTSIFLAARTVFSYYIQDTAPQQTVVLLWAILKLIAVCAAYFVFFKASKARTEDIPKLLFNLEDRKHLILSMAEATILVAILVGGYINYRQHQAYLIQQAFDQLNEMCETFAEDHYGFNPCD